MINLLLEQILLTTNRFKLSRIIFNQCRSVINFYTKTTLFLLNMLELNTDLNFICNLTAKLRTVCMYVYERVYI